MEAKLAEFRQKHGQKKSLINWHEISSRLTSIFSYSSKKISKSKSEEQKEEEGEEEESVINWQIIVIKFFLWLTLFVIFIRLEFGAIYFIMSLLYLIWSNLGSRRRRNELSAYSVFNPNFEKIQGTFSGEDYDRQLRRDGCFQSWCCLACRLHLLSDCLQLLSQCSDACLTQFYDPLNNCFRQEKLNQFIVNIVGIS